MKKKAGEDLKATARIGNTEWQSAIWFDTKADVYLLPLKAELRKKEKIQPEMMVEVVIYIQVNSVEAGRFSIKMVLQLGFVNIDFKTKS